MRFNRNRADRSLRVWRTLTGFATGFWLQARQPFEQLFSNELATGPKAFWLIRHFAP
jgi:hypothetical protein